MISPVKPWENFDNSKFEIGQKPNFGFCPVTYDGNPFLFEVPIMPVPFGANFNKEHHRYTLDLSFRSMHSDPKVMALFSMLKDIQKQVVDTGRYSSFSDVVRPAREPYMPLFRVKLPYNIEHKQFEFKLFDADKKVISFKSPEFNLLEAIPRHATVQAIIQCEGIWSMNGHSGMSWKTKHILIHESNTSTNLSQTHAFNNPRAKFPSTQSSFLDDDDDM